MVQKQSETRKGEEIADSRPKLQEGLAAKTHSRGKGLKNRAENIADSDEICDSGQASHKNWNTAITEIEEMYVDDVITSKNIGVATHEGKEEEKPASIKQKRKHRTDSLAVLMPVDDAASKILDSVSGEKRACTKQTRKRKMDSITLETIQQYFGKPIGEASRRLGVSRSTLKRICRELKIASWPMPHRSKKYAHFGISVVVLLIVRIKRWICSSNHHGFSAMWWICGKHNALVCELNTLAIISPKSETICRPLYMSQLTKESDESLETTTPFSKPPQVHFDVYQASLKKKQVVNVSDTRIVTVKATFKNDIIKFQLPISSGVLELKNQVAQRVKLKSTRLLLKYMDEDDDLILIACDADFRNLMPFSASSFSKNTIKLIVQIADN